MFARGCIMTPAHAPQTCNVLRAFPENRMSTRTAVALALTTLAAGCASMMPAEPGARATLAATAGNQASGTVSFVKRGDKVRVSAKVAGLSPGPHGFHIHEKGDCSAPDAMSAGGHFNPSSKPHGDPAAADHHAGDMPMLTADATGNATLEATIDAVSIGSGAGDIVGRAVVIHKDADDFKTQPTGNSGARVACGVIARS
jgi:superoxide dismutase, Cu-Zn family